MDTNIAYLLMIATLGYFGYIGYQVTTNEEIDGDSYLSARGSQNSIRIGLSLFASGMVYGCYLALQRWVITVVFGML